MNPFLAALTVGVDKLLPELEAVYKDFHQNPEWSMQEVRDYMMSAIGRICYAECVASNASREPVFTTFSSYPLADNDATAGVAKAFEAPFGDHAFETCLAAGSQDFNVFGRRWNVPYVFWIVGSSNPQVCAKVKADKQINLPPSNHSPKDAPHVNSTLKTTLLAMLSATTAWFCEGKAST